MNCKVCGAACRPLRRVCDARACQQSELSRIRNELVISDRRLLAAGLRVPEIQDAIRSLYDLGVDHREDKPVTGAGQ